MIPNPSYILDILPGHETSWLDGLMKDDNRERQGEDRKEPLLSITPGNGRSGTAVLHVKGALYGWSYEYIKHVLSRWDNNENVEDIVMDFDSPGGLAAGCQDCAEAVKSVQKPVTAHVRGMAASAAYWLASAAREIKVKPDAVIGSVGTVIAHFDISNMLSQAGIKVTFITAGEGKVDGNSYEPLSKAGLAKYQKVIDEHYLQFSGGVAENRGVEQKVVKDDWKAHIYTGRESIENGMADSMLRDEKPVTVRRAYARHRLTPR